MAEARPSTVVIASQWGIEGWMARQASLRGVRTIQVMHGVMTGPFHARDVVTDELLVPGPFWREIWPAAERRKIRVDRPAGWFPAAARDVGRRRLTYFSWPLHLLPAFNASELMDAFIGIFKRLASKGCSVHIHCHPLENPADLLRRWKEIAGEMPREVTIGKHRPTPEVMRQTDVALMFRSTVMIDCLASGVPFVMPGWIDLGLNRLLDGLPGVRFSVDLGDLERTLEAWLEDSPVVPEEVRRRFVS